MSIRTAPDRDALRPLFRIKGIWPAPERAAVIKPVSGADEGEAFERTPATAGRCIAWRPRPRRHDIERGVAELSHAYCSRFGDVYDEVGHRYGNLSHKRRPGRPRAWLSDTLRAGTGWRARPTRLDVPVIMLGASTAHMYFHWLIDVLPRYFLARAAGRETGRWLYVPCGLPFQSETLAALGLLGRVIDVDADPLISAHDVIVPSHQLACGHLLPPWVLRFLRGELQPALGAVRGAACRRIYVSRNDAARRRLTNESDVIEALAGYGFRAITPGRMSVAEQATSFAGANVIVATHGSALANLAFARPGTIVIELFPHRYFDDGPYRLSQSLSMRYAYVRARAVTAAGRPNEADYSIDPEDLLATLTLVGVTRL